MSDEGARVYLQGDEMHIATTLTQDQVAGALRDTEEVEAESGIEGFTRLPLADDEGVALVRPKIVSSIMPPYDEGQD